MFLSPLIGEFLLLHGSTGQKKCKGCWVLMKSLGFLKGKCVRIVQKESKDSRCEGKVC
jgi:hypothetical protein